MVKNRFEVMKVARWMLWLQGIYFAVMGVWPLVHMRSFLWVTGPKTDLWLVQTVGAILAVIGVSFCVGGSEREVSPATVVLAVGSAMALAAVDVVFTAERVISPIYLLDAAAEVAILIAWSVLAWLAFRGQGRRTGHLAMALR